MKRAEARAAEMEKQRAEKKAREDAMGDVQRREKEERKKELEDAKFLTLGRSADDEEMNTALREKLRWDDPMAAYMAEKRAEATSSRVGEKGSGQSVAAPARRGKKVYQGHAPPNRYGILPGWRWDGVDRGNGFEKEWFQARGRKTRNQDLEYQWQMDE
jgi:pre-mRNA-splicing factor CWC26